MAGQTQLAALGLQDEYFSGSPQISFFKKVFTKYAPFFIKSKEIPFNGSSVTFNNSHVCEIKKDGDIIRYIILKTVLPSLFKEGQGKCFPKNSTSFRPTAYFLDSDLNIIKTERAKNCILYYNTLNKSWLPNDVSIQNDYFQFEKPDPNIVYLAFTSSEDSLFWGFSREDEFREGFYLYNIAKEVSILTSQLSLSNSGWLNSFFPYFRYYNKNTGLSLIDRVELFVGGQLIESVTNEYINIYKEIDVTDSQQDSYFYLLGTGKVPAISDVEYFLKIPFSTKDICVSALERQNLEVHVYTKSFLEILDSNGYNITTSNAITNYSQNVRAALNDGAYDYVITSNSITKYFSNLSNTVVSNFPLTGLYSNFVLGGSNIYALDRSNTENLLLFSWSTTSNTSKVMEMSNVFKTSQSVGLVSTTNNSNIFNFTTSETFERIELNKPVQRISFPYPSIDFVYSFNNYAIVVIVDRIYVQTLTSPYSILTYVTSEFGRPIKFSHSGSSLFYITANSLVSFDIFSGKKLATRQWSGNPTHLVVLPSYQLVVFDSVRMNVYSTTDSTVVLQKRITDIAESPLTNSVYLTYESGGIDLYTISPAGYRSALDTSNVYSNIIIGSSFNYIYSRSTNRLRQVEKTTLWSDSILKASVVTQLSGRTFFAFEDANDNIYYTGSNNSNIFYRPDSSLFASVGTETVITSTTVLRGLSNIFYNGDYIYSFPTTGASNVYRYNTNYELFSPSSHQIVELKNNEGAAKEIYSATLAFTSSGVYSFSTIQVSEIIFYKTSLPFHNPDSFVSYDLSISAPNIIKSDYSKTILYDDKIVFASNTNINKFLLNSTGITIVKTGQVPLGLYSGETGLFNAGSAYNGKFVYTFTSNLGANGVFKTTLTGTGLSTTRINAGAFPSFGKYRTLVQLNDNQTVYLIPNNGANLVTYNMTTEGPFVVNMLSFLPGHSITNGSNTACLVGNILYIFPTVNNNNVFAFNTSVTVSSAFSNLLTPVSTTRYVSSTYDGSIYVYLTDALGNIVRFNTTFDVFNDLSGYTPVSFPFDVSSAFVKTTSVGGNVTFVTRSNIYSWNIASQSYRGNVTIQQYNLSTRPVIAKQGLLNNNVFVFGLGSNIWTWGSDRTVSNLFTVNLRDRSNSTTKSIIDLAVNRSNIFVSWDDNTVGVLNYSSNDISGIYTISPSGGPVLPAYEIPQSMAVHGTNVYILTNNIYRYNPTTFTSDFRSLSSTSGNNYKYTTTIGSNLYVFPSTGNLFARFDDSQPLASGGTAQLNIANVSAFVSFGNFLYGASRDSNSIFEYDTTKSFVASNFTINQMKTLTGISFSCAHSVNSNIIFLPYKSNSICGYKTDLTNFSNTVGLASFTSTTFSNISNIVRPDPGGIFWAFSTNTPIDGLSNTSSTTIDINGSFSTAVTRISDKIKRKWRMKREDNGESGQFDNFYQFTKNTNFNSLTFTSSYVDLSDQTDPSTVFTSGSGNRILRYTWYIYVYKTGPVTLEMRPYVTGGFRTPTCHITYISSGPGLAVTNSPNYFNAFTESHKRAEITISAFFMQWTSNGQPVPGNQVTFGFMYSSISELLSTFKLRVPDVLVSDGDRSNYVNSSTFLLDVVNNRLRLSWGNFGGAQYAGITVLYANTIGFTDGQVLDMTTVTSYQATKLIDDTIYKPVTSNSISSATQGMYQVVMYTNSVGSTSRIVPEFKLGSDPLSYDYYFSDVNDYPSAITNTNRNTLDESQRSFTLKTYFNFNPLNFAYANNFFINKIANYFVKVTPSSLQLINRENYVFKAANVDRAVGNVFAVDKYLYITTASVSGASTPNWDYVEIYDTTTLSSTSTPVATFEPGFQERFVMSIQNNGNTVYVLYQIHRNAFLRSCELVTYNLGTSTKFGTTRYWTTSGTDPRYSNIANSTISFQMSDGVCFAPSDSYNANLTAVSLTTTISSSLGFVEGQRFSCVISYNNFTYLLPSNGNIMTRVDRTSFVSSLSSAFQNFNLASVINTPGVHTVKFDVRGSLDGANSLYLYLRTLDGTNVSNILVFNTITGTFDPPVGQATISSSDAYFTNNRFYVTSNINNSLLVYQKTYTGNPYFEYFYPIPSILSNSVVVHRNVAYMFPGEGSPSLNIVQFDLTNFSNVILQHDAPVVDHMRISQNDYVIISRNKINIFSYNTSTRLLVSNVSASFTNPDNRIVSRNFDGRYISIFTGSRTVVFDFTDISKNPVVYTGEIGSGMASIYYYFDGTIFTANNFSVVSNHYAFRTNPRSYYELNTPFNAPATGLISFTNNLYCVSSGIVYSLAESINSRNPTVITTLPDTNIIDSTIFNSNILYLSTSYVTSVNVITSVQNFSFTKPTQYNTQLITGLSNIYVTSSSDISIFRTNGLYSNIADRSNIFETVNGTLFNLAFSDNTANVYYVTNNNDDYRFNFRNSPFYIKQLPALFSNVYHSTLTKNKIYYFPGSNAVANTILVYDTTKGLPFYSPTSYSNINLPSYQDIRSSVVSGDRLYGCGYFSTNIIAINTISDTVLDKTYDLDANAASNAFVSPIFDGKSFILTPSTSNVINRVFMTPIIADKSFSNTIPGPTADVDKPLVDLVQNGNTMYYIYSSNIYQLDINNDNSETVNQTGKDIFISSTNIGAANYDGRFFKYYTSNLSVMDMDPLIVPQTFSMSSIVNYVFLTKEERKWMSNQALQYPFTQIQTANLNLAKRYGFYKVNFTNMVKEFLILIDKGELRNIELFLNGYSKSKLDSGYLKDLGIYLYHQRSTNLRIYSYSLTSDGNGYLNMSRVSEQIMFIEVSELCNISIFAMSDNILTIKDGLGGLVFGTRDR